MSRSPRLPCCRVAVNTRQSVSESLRKHTILSTLRFTLGDSGSKAEQARRCVTRHAGGGTFGLAGATKSTTTPTPYCSFSVCVRATHFREAAGAWLLRQWPGEVLQWKPSWQCYRRRLCSCAICGALIKCFGACVRGFDCLLCSTIAESHRCNSRDHTQLRVRVVLVFCRSVRRFPLRYAPAAFVAPVAMLIVSYIHRSVPS